MGSCGGWPAGGAGVRHRQGTQSSLWAIPGRSSLPAQRGHWLRSASRMQLCLRHWQGKQSSMWMFSAAGACQDSMSICDGGQLDVPPFAVLAKEAESDCVTSSRMSCQHSMGSVSVGRTDGPPFSALTRVAERGCAIPSRRSSPTQLGFAMVESLVATLFPAVAREAVRRVGHFKIGTGTTSRRRSSPTQCRQLKRVASWLRGCTRSCKRGRAAYGHPN